jgi:hypothetical protein
MAILFERIAKEKDHQKFTRFVEELNDLLDGKKRRFVGKEKSELSIKKSLTVRCPTCGAVPGEKCELGTGQPRTHPHFDRRVIAADES